jgi:hypothetical protein
MEPPYGHACTKEKLSQASLKSIKLPARNSLY